MLAFFVLFILAMLAVSGTYTFIVACVRRKELPWFIKEELEKSPYGKYYDSIIAADHWLKDHNAEDVFIESVDGLRLHGLWVPAENSKGTMVLVHGYRSTKYVDFGAAFPLYHEMGFNLLIPDQRCHGKSEGRFITFGVKECKDILCWIDYHNQKFGMQPVILSGLSMGASTVMFAADEPLPDNVRGIISDCGFTSPRDIISCVFRDVTHLPAAPSLWFTNILAKIFAGFSLTEKDSRKSLAKNKRAVLLIHGTADDFVPCYMTKESYRACSGFKKLLLVEGAGHGVSFLVDRDRYIREIKGFLSVCLDKEC